ncbi:MAG: UDP-glucose 4-epimerase GalE [Deltaproteobacteria bacterium]|jgi:UDP-glucose 4-epimerase|nr:UDP-glucose 4-epimerase GalE [Deltaproteobacteria bacterium]MBW2534181.1 UDP-glucose 4-epimerase GalE [Deltaproteobacteria bacterium]
MSTYLIVGGAGYIGSHVVKALADQGNEVITLDDLSKGHRAAVTTGKFIEGDLGDEVHLGKIFSAHAIDCVMHFAAYSLVGESVEQPLAYYQNNTGKTANLLLAMKKHGVDKFIFSSTAATYGEPVRVPIEEDDPTVPTNPYGRSKLYIEHMLHDAAHAHGLKYVALRYFNAAGADPSGTIGEDHSPESHLIPIVLQVALDQRKSIKIFGTDWDTPDGTCLRDYIHVNDLADAHILAAERLIDGGRSGTFNLGNEAGYSVKEIIDISRKVTGHPIPAEAAPRRAGDPAKLVASSGRIQSELGWKPRYDSPEAIVETAWKWHQSHPTGFGDRD